MAAFAKMRDLDVWYAFVFAGPVCQRPAVAGAGGGAAPGRPGAPVPGRRPGRPQELHAHPEHRAAHLLSGYRFAQLARKLVGVGSVGTRAWIALMLGRDGDDPLILQFKEAQQSVLSGYAPRRTFANEGHRVVVGQRLMQASSDIFLGWQRVSAFDGVTRDFYVRQRGTGRDRSRSSRWRRSGWRRTPGSAAGPWPGRTHAQATGSRSLPTSAPATSSTGALATFSSLYADQNERDHAELAAAVQTGRITADERW